MDTFSTSSIISLKAGQLNQAVQELKAFLQQILSRDSYCNVCGRKSEKEQNLEKELHQCLKQFEQRKIQLKQIELENKIKDEDIQRTKNKLLLLEAKLRSVEEERLILRADVGADSGDKE